MYPLHDFATDRTYVAGPGQTDFAMPCRLFPGYEYAFVVEINGVAQSYTPVPTGAGQFTAAATGTEGCYIILGAPCAGGESVHIRRALPRERLTGLPESGPVSIADLNAELDRIVALIQDTPSQTLEPVVISAPSAPRRLSYCKPRLFDTNLPGGLRTADNIHNYVVGHARAAGITGGLGGVTFLVDNESLDPNVENSFPYAWAKVQALAANAPWRIVFTPAGYLNIPFDQIQRIDRPNGTIIAPGRNVTFWTYPLAGGLQIRTSNIIIAYIPVRTMPGVLAVYDDDSGVKTERKLIDLQPQLCDKIAFVGVEGFRASDGALDMSASTLLAGSAPCRVTVQDFIFWGTDQPMLIGSTDPTCAVGDATPLQVTLHNGIFAYCGERQPKVIGRATVDMSNVYVLTLPFKRDQLAPVAEFSVCYGSEAMSGGKLNVRGCLYAAADDIGGYPATQIAVDANGQDGAVVVADSAAEDGMTFGTGNAGRLGALPYALDHTPVPAVGPLREAWIAERWQTCGARADSAPEGLFSWTADTTQYPDGLRVLTDRILGGRWIRVDQGADVIAEGERDRATTAALFVIPRGPTLTLAGDAINIDGITTSFFAIDTEAAGATDNLVNINSTATPANGVVLRLRCVSAARVITIKTTGNIAATKDIVLDQVGKIVELEYDTGSAKWGVVGRPNAVTSVAGRTGDIVLSSADISDLADAAYTPTITNVANCAVLTLNKAWYKRQGKTVVVWASVNITPTATATDTTCTIDLPIADDLVVAGDLIGVGASNSAVAVDIGVVYPSVGLDKAIYRFKPSALTAKDHQISFSFRLP